jgi:hypothetical protein
MTEQHERVFKYKLDFYYQSALIYLVTLILYGGIRGNFVEKKFEYVLDDPIMYIIMFFVLMSLGILLLNYIRRRRLVITDESIRFTNRWYMRSIAIAEIEWMHIGREARVQTSGRFQVVMIKLRGRRRVFRVRVGRYEREGELVAEMQKIAAKAPARKQGRWRKPRFTDR